MLPQLLQSVSTDDGTEPSPLRSPSVTVPALPLGLAAMEDLFSQPAWKNCSFHTAHPLLSHVATAILHLMRHSDTLFTQWTTFQDVLRTKSFTGGMNIWKGAEELWCSTFHFWRWGAVLADRGGSYRTRARASVQSPVKEARQSQCKATHNLPAIIWPCAVSYFLTLLKGRALIISVCLEIQKRHKLSWRKKSTLVYLEV